MMIMIYIYIERERESGEETERKRGEQPSRFTKSNRLDYYLDSVKGCYVFFVLRREKWRP